MAGRLGDLIEVRMPRHGRRKCHYYDYLFGLVRQ
jgi:hypothetical protein